MKKTIFLLLASSVTANAWLLLRPAPSAPPEKLAVPDPVPPPTARASLESAVARLLAAPDPGDLAKLRDDLRAAGIDDSSIRGVLEGSLRARYNAQLAAWHTENQRNEWWRRGAGSGGGTGQPSLRTLVHDPLQALLGRDPLDLGEAKARYDFLSEEKRALLAAIDVDYTELRARTPRTARTAAATKSELDEQKLLTEERRKDVLAALTPEERAEYELRFSKTAVFNARRFAALDVSEQEFRAIQPLIETMRTELDRVPGANRHETTAQFDIEQRTLDQLVSAVGYDRTLDYVWGSDSGPYASTARVLREVELPAHNASQLLQLAAETGERATAIHYDMALSPEQKRAALLALQQTVRPKLDGLVPAAVQPKLEESAIGWFNVLSDGRYMIRPLTLAGSGYAMVSPIAVTTPVAGARPARPHVRLPGK